MSGGHTQEGEGRMSDTGSIDTDGLTLDKMINQKRFEVLRKAKEIAAYIESPDVMLDEQGAINLVGQAAHLSRLTAELSAFFTVRFWQKKARGE